MGSSVSLIPNGRISIKETQHNVYCLTGDHETNSEIESEADLHKHLTGCKKNPGHKHFIPISSFHIDHLPENYRDSDIYELIQSVSDLSVRVDVKKISTKRPEFWPGTQVIYPFYDNRGSETMRTASGNISVVQFENGHNVADIGMNNFCGDSVKEYQTCPCDRCTCSDQPSNVWWEIMVFTATHVVFDDEEVNHTSCKLFFDTLDSPAVILDTFTLKEAKIEEDVCKFKLETCDKLGYELLQKFKHFLNVWEKVTEKYKNNTNKDTLSFIVSHPHGCPKQVSVGYLKDSYKVGEYRDKRFDLSRLTYTTCTCPGSSGAKVYCVGFKCHVHSGTLGSGLNYSSVGFSSIQ